MTPPSGWKKSNLKQLVFGKDCKLHFVHGEPEPMKKIGQIYDFARGWRSIETTMLALDANLGDFESAWDCGEIDPIRLYRYYRDLGLFSQSRYTPKALKYPFSKAEALSAALDLC